MDPYSTKQVVEIKPKGIYINYALKENLIRSIENSVIDDLNEVNSHGISRLDSCVIKFNLDIYDKSQVYDSQKT